MSRHEKPWTFEPFEIDTEQTFIVYDPNLAQMVAIFYNADEAEDYLRWRNKKQAKKARKKAEAKVKLAGWGWSAGDDFDDDGRC